jgi:phage recombination protein Bet
MATAELARVTYTDDQVALISRTIAPGLSPDELTLFMAVCQRTGLDPFAKQIYGQKRSGKLVIQTGIDGYRLIADRTGCYVGNDDPVFDDEDNPRKATVTVYKMVNGQRCPFSASARWEQYFPGEQQGFMWKKMPHLMLGKCAEALALRKAFPAELSGLYTDTEMEQADTRTTPPARQADQPHVRQLPAANDPMSISNDKKAFNAIMVSKGQTWATTIDWINHEFHAEHTSTTKWDGVPVEQRLAATEQLLLMPDAKGA